MAFQVKRYGTTSIDKAIGQCAWHFKYSRVQSTSRSSGSSNSSSIDINRMNR